MLANFQLIRFEIILFKGVHFSRHKNKTCALFYSNSKKSLSNQMTLRFAATSYLFRQSCGAQNLNLKSTANLGSAFCALKNTENGRACKS